MSVIDRVNRIQTPSTSSATSTRPRLVLWVLVIVAVAFPIVSAVVGLSDHVQHWGKVVHAVEGACVTTLFGILLIGWRDCERIDITDELAGLMTILVGVVFGVVWEIVTFIIDWTTDSDFQKSNTDTMTDFLCNDVAVVVAALIVVRLMARLGTQPKRSIGETAEWLVDGPSRVLDRHGLALALITSALIIACVAVLWWAGRPVPGLPIP